MGSESPGPCDVSLPPLNLSYIYTYLGGQIGAVIDFGPSHQIGAVFLRKWAVIYFYISNSKARLALFSEFLALNGAFIYFRPSGQIGAEFCFFCSQRSFYIYVPYEPEGR